MANKFSIKEKVFQTWTMSGTWGLFLSLAVSFFPLALWLLAQPLNMRFNGLSASLTSVGQATGLVGMAMMSVVVILSTRTVFLDSLFNGLNNLYKAHREMGIASFLLLMVHPLVLSASYLPFSKSAAALFLMPGADLARNLGIAAVLLMMLFVTLTIFAKMKYQFLKLSHKMFVVVFLLSALHTIFVKSDISRSPLIHWYMFGLMIAGFTALSYKTLFSRFLVKKFIYFVKEVNQMPDKTTEVVMVPQKEKLIYYPGQFVFISFRGSGIGSESHPFSIASSPNDLELKILVKSLGDYTSKIAKLPISAKVEVEGAFGALSYLKAQNKNQLWIGGGSGIVPFVGMARDIKNYGQGYNVDLYYCANSKQDIIHLEELSAINLNSGAFRFIPFCQNESGFLNAEKILKLSGGIWGKDILLCGPPPMVKSLKGQFAQLKIPKNRIHSEEFQLL